MKAFTQGKDISLVGGRKQDRFGKRWGNGEGRVKGQVEKQKVGGQKRGLIHDQERSYMEGRKRKVTEEK